MKVVISIHHPAWAHQFRQTIKQLQNEGHIVKVFTVKKDNNLFLLEKFEIEHELLANSTGKGIAEKAWLFTSITFKTIWRLRNFNPDVFIGRASPMMAIAAFFYRRPHIIYEDTERSRISLFFCKHLSRLIINPTSFKTDLGKVQKRLPIYKESFYLHPNRFAPDENILAELGVKKGEIFTLMRFVAWTADHDFGHSGLSMKTKTLAVTEFEKYGPVFITSEVPLPLELEKYRINISPEKIHSAMYYATLFYSESATMASECAMLGTHAIFSYFGDICSTEEQEKKYGLVYNFRLDNESQLQSVKKGVELLKTEHLWKTGKKKREFLLNETLDGSQVFMNELAQFCFPAKLD